MGEKLNNFIKILNKYNFIIACLLCAALSFSTLWIQEVVFILYICFVVISSFFYDTNKIIVLCSFSAFYINCFGYDVSLIILSCALLFRCIILTYKKKYKINLHLIIFVAIIAVIIISSIIANNGLNGILYGILPCGLIVFVEIYILRKEIKLDYLFTTIARLFVLSCVLSLIAKNMKPDMHVFYLDDSGLNAFRGFFKNASSLSVWCLVILSQNLMLFATKRIGYIFFYFYTLMTSIIGFCGLNEIFLIFYLLLLVLYFIVEAQKSKKFCLIQISVFLIIVSILFACSDIIPVLNQKFSIYDNFDLINKLTFGKCQIWLDSLNHWSSQGIGAILFGLGETSIFDLNNTIVGILVRYGIIGLIATVFFVLYFFIITKKNRESNIKKYIPLIAVVFCILMEEFFSYQVLVIILSMLAILKYEKEQHSSKYKILYFNNRLTMGGAEIYMINVIENLSCDFDFDVSTFAIPQNANTLNVQRLLNCKCNIYYNGGKNKILYCFNLFKFFINNCGKYDIMHINATSKEMGLIAYMARVYGKIDKIIFHSHKGGNVETQNKVSELIGDYLAKVYSTDFAACSKAAANYMFGEKFCKNNTIKILNNSIDINKFEFDLTKRQTKRKELGFENNFVVLHIGRFAKQKNQEKLINVFKRIHQKDDTAKLVLVGDESEIKEKLMQKVKLLELDSVVIFMKQRDDINELMLASDIFVLTSFHEGLPIVAVEAQTSGLPVVLSSCISKETAITDNCEFVDLNQSDEIWADKILAMKNHKRKKENESIIKHGFDNKSAMEEIKKLYLK